jgi:hypothetical protein
VSGTTDSSVGIIQKRFVLRSKRLKLLQHITSTEKRLRFEFWANIMDRTAKDVTFLSKICSREEETFCLCEKVGRPNIRTCGCENPHAMVEHVRKIPKTNVFLCSDLSQSVLNFHLRREKQLNGITYCDVLEL